MMRIELTPSAWKAEVLPLNYIRKNWSGRRDSNSRPSPWQGDALPLSHFRIIIGRGGWIRTIESSANGFTVRPLWPLGNPSKFVYIVIRQLGHRKTGNYYYGFFTRKMQVLFNKLASSDLGADGGNRTPNLLITNQLLYR